MSRQPSTTELYSAPTREAMCTVLLVAFGAPGNELGRRILVDGEIVIGRGMPDFAYAPKSVSRRHAAITSDAAQLTIRDLGSRQGTWINGVRVEARTLVIGDVIAVGELGLLVARAPRTFVPQRTSSIDHWSWAMAQALDEATTMVRLGRPLALCGESGVGKRRLAAAIAAAQEPHANLLVVDPAVPLAVSRAQLASAGATDLVLFDRMAEAQAPLVELCVELMRRREHDDAASRIAISLGMAGDEPSPMPEALLPYCEAAMVRVPALAERIEDILPIAYRRLREIAGVDVALAASFALRLLRRRFVGNVRSLLTEVDRAWARRGAGEEPLASEEPAGDSTYGTVLVAADASFIESAAGERSSLERRPVLRAILRALLSALAEQRVASPRDLCEAGWPGERMSEASATNRVYVSIATLRKLGLGAALRSAEGGYRLTDEGTLRVVGGVASAAPTK